MRTSVRIAMAGTAVLAGVAFASPAFAAGSTYSTGTGHGTTTTTVVAHHSAIFVAGGFRPGSAVHVTVSDGRSYTVTANSSGNISLSIAFGGAGNYSVSASGVAAGGGARTVGSNVAVTGGAATGGTGTTGTVASTTSSSSNDTGGLPFTGLEFGAIAGLGAATLIGGATVRVVARKRVAEAA
jgi:hypothetical protein